LHHPNTVANFRITNWLTDVTKELNLSSRITVDSFDDESYFTSSFPMPEC
jgi:hypothetical protein